MKQLNSLFYLNFIGYLSSIVFIANTFESLCMDGTFLILHLLRATMSPNKMCIIQGNSVRSPSHCDNYIHLFCPKSAKWLGFVQQCNQFNFFLYFERNNKRMGCIIHQCLFYNHQRKIYCKRSIVVADPTPDQMIHTYTYFLFNMLTTILWLRKYRNIITSDFQSTINCYWKASIKWMCICVLLCMVCIFIIRMNPIALDFLLRKYLLLNIEQICLIVLVENSNSNILNSI